MRNLNDWRLWSGRIGRLWGKSHIQMRFYTDLLEENGGNLAREQVAAFLFVLADSHEKQKGAPLTGTPFVYSQQFLLLHFHIHTLAMTGKFRGIHTLYGSNAITECTGVRYEQGILKHVCAFGQLAKEEIGTCIFG